MLTNANLINGLLAGIIYSPPLSFLFTGAATCGVRLRNRPNFQIFLVRGVKVTKVDLTASKVPETAPKWLNNYGKHVKNEVLFDEKFSLK